MGWDGDLKGKEETNFHIGWIPGCDEHSNLVIDLIM